MTTKTGIIETHYYYMGHLLLKHTAAINGILSYHTALFNRALNKRWRKHLNGSAVSANVLRRI